MSRAHSIAPALCLLFASAASLHGAVGDPPGRLFAAPASTKTTRTARLRFSNGLILCDARLVFRDGQTVPVLPAGQPQRLDIAPADIESLRITVTEEGEERQWRWKEGGSDEKVYTGKSYPWRKHGIALKLRDGTEITGHLSQALAVRIEASRVDLDAMARAARDKGADEQAPVTMKEKQAVARPAAALAAKVPGLRPDASDASNPFALPKHFQGNVLLQPRAKGELGETLDGLVYLEELVFTPAEDDKEAF